MEVCLKAKKISLWTPWRLTPMWWGPKIATHVLSGAQLCSNLFSLNCFMCKWETLCSVSKKRHPNCDLTIEIRSSPCLKENKVYWIHSTYSFYNAQEGRSRQMEATRLSSSVCWVSVSHMSMEIQVLLSPHCQGIFRKSNLGESWGGELNITTIKQLSLFVNHKIGSRGWFPLHFQFKW